MAKKSIIYNEDGSVRRPLLHAQQELGEALFHVSELGDSMERIRYFLMRHGKHSHRASQILAAIEALDGTIQAFDSKIQGIDP
jgi:hypothetical protein